MTTIAGAFRSDGAPAQDVELQRMLAAARMRKGDRIDLAAGVAGATARPTESATLIDDGCCIVAADASLYYRDDLVRSLRAAGVGVRGASAAELILAAYEAWGDRCAEHLEGDFAFFVWDRPRGTLVAGRDFGGKRPLHFAFLGHAVLLGSAVGTVAAHHACPRDLDLREIAADAAGLLFADRTGTCFRAVKVLPAGSTLLWSPGASPRVQRHWTPPVFGSGRSRTSFADAAMELRSLLERSVAERMPAEGDVAVWLSGGWDSTAVFAAGQHVLAQRGEGSRLRPVSISYPPGDSGREDELIAETAAFWRRDVEWIGIDSIPFLREPETEAASRDEPFAHAFEHWNRALARRSAAIGCQVAFDGCGGDQLFQVSNVLLADLLRRGRLLEMALEWRAKQMGPVGIRGLVQWAVQPLLPDGVQSTIARVRGGRHLRGYLERELPPFLRADAVRTLDLPEYTRPAIHRRHRSPTAAEHELYLTSPFFPRIFSMLGGLALDEGVELRSPLYDARIVAFAATRPVAERSHRRETKRLLREAMRGLLPEAVLTPRTARTGTTADFFARSMRLEFGRYLGYLTDEPVLADLGIIEPLRVRDAWRRYQQTGHDGLGVSLFFTLQTELWLRAHAARGIREETTATPSGTPESQAV